MCLILFTFDTSSDTPLILAANRDEFFARPTAAAHFWEDHHQVLAGRDLQGKGTWIGITRTGRFAAVTNVRELGADISNLLSRGDLTRQFLTGTDSCSEYLESIQEDQAKYSGFNLLVGEFNASKKEMFYFSNRQEGIKPLTSGTYGLSNHLLDSGWPKVKAGKTYLDSMLAVESEEERHYALRKFLEDPSQANDQDLPKTGVSYEFEKALSAAFIRLPNYGTRTSTVLTIDHQHTVFSEKNYSEDGSEQTAEENSPTFFELAGYLAIA